MKKANTTLTAATDASDTAERVMISAQNASLDMSSTVVKVAHFLDMEKATRDDIESVGPTLSELL